jgi:hypothetical protein
VTDMLALAAARRSGQHPVYTSTWGATIRALPDLKTLELILETFSVKRCQLDAIVECAKTWKFPLHDTQYELTYDGRVESTKWAKPVDGDSDCGRETETRSQGIPFDENSSSPHGEIEGPGGQREASPRGQDVLPDIQDHYNPTSPTYETDERWNGPASPTYSGSEYEPGYWQDTEDPNGGGDTSPVYNPDGTADDWGTSPDEPWMRSANHFEVRIVRFRRQRATEIT